MNIAFSYLYRDSGNYKRFNTIVFSNFDFLAVDELRKEIDAHLKDGEWFCARKWNVPDLHFAEWDEELDHHWHEFHSVEETSETATSGDISCFLLKLMHLALNSGSVFSSQKNE